jgi:hypothetical protein
VQRPCGCTQRRGGGDRSRAHRLRARVNARASRRASPSSNRRARR